MIDAVINELLNGASARYIIEDVPRVAASTIALLMKYHGMSEQEATKEAFRRLGQLPDEDLLHQVTKPFGVSKVKGKETLQHRIKMGHHSP